MSDQATLTIGKATWTMCGRVVTIARMLAENEATINKADRGKLIFNIGRSDVTEAHELMFPPVRTELDHAA